MSRIATSTGPQVARRRAARRLGPLAAAALAATLAASLSLAACGSDDADSATTDVVATSPAGTSPADTIPASSPPTEATDAPAPDHTGHSMPDGSMPHETVPVDPSVSLPDAPSDDPRTVDVTLSEYAFQASKASVPAGPITFDVTNAGAESHHMMVGKLHEGETRESFLATFEESGEGAAMATIDSSGGITALAPGESGEVVSHLEEGSYLFICYMPAPDGTRHLMLDMLTDFTVTAADDEVPADPVAEQTIVAGDYVLAIPEGFTGQGVVELQNVGQEAHEISLMRLADGKTFDDVLAWYGAPAGPPPFTDVGGIGVIEPGGSAWANMALTPGHYLAVCFVSTADGVPHALVGMQAEFDIA